ncbi:MAG: ABC transporter permease subunit [Chthoniobacter sp.]|nr:ABC transporter permease subunit [Chthoniobacter sp.]
MLSYLVRRLLYVPLIVLGVMLLTFVLSFVVQTPEERARGILDKKATPEAIRNYLHERGYDKPLLVNHAPGTKWHDSIFFNEMTNLARLRLGKSDITGEPLADKFLKGAVPSLAITLPAAALGLFLAVSLSLYLVLVRYSALDRVGTIGCVMLMSIVPMLYIFAGQSLLGSGLKWFPVSGFDLSQWAGVRFLILPVVIFCVINLGEETRIYRAVFLEEIARDYVRTARAKGVDNSLLLFTHVLKNGLISLITLVVAHLPLLVLGSLLTENFFGIPGLGNLLASALQSGDFAVVRVSVFLGALLYQSGLIATDICYALADPRIRLGGNREVEVAARFPWRKVLLVGACAYPLWLAVTALWRAFFAFHGGSIPAFFGKLFADVRFQNSLVIAGFAAAGLFLYLNARNEVWHRALARLRRDRIGLLAGVVISLYLFIGALETIQVSDGHGGWESKLHQLTAGIPDEETFSAPFAKVLLTKPTPLKGTHIFGTDALGKDVFVQCLRACRTALLIGGLTSALYIPVGAILGLAAGYFRRRTDEVITYFYSVVASIPTILLLVAIIGALGKSFFSMTGALAFTSWVGICRLVRGETMRQSGSQYVDAARALGQSHWRILTRHLLPNVMHLILITFILGFSNLVLFEVILSYLGVGLPVGTASWGAMIDGARGELTREPLIWWNLAAASGALFGLVLSLNLLGDALRRAFDPKQG